MNWSWIIKNEEECKMKAHMSAAKKIFMMIFKNVSNQVREAAFKKQGQEGFNFAWYRPAASQEPGSRPHGRNQGNGLPALERPAGLQPKPRSCLKMSFEVARVRAFKTSKQSIGVLAMKNFAIYIKYK